MQSNVFKHKKQKIFSGPHSLLFNMTLALSCLCIPIHKGYSSLLQSPDQYAFIVDTENTQTSGQVKTYSIFGKKYQSVPVVSNSLQGAVYYLVSGHGGPDPGAVARYNGKLLCEDEYAYDITLRLARELISQGAMVYMITRDPNDGIRDGWYLAADQDEVCYPNKSIPINQMQRLRQRVESINQIYLANKARYRYHRMIEIHVDSRSTGQNADVFFYYNKGSQPGRKFAGIMRDTFENKYKKHQPGRGYEGSVSSRNLYMLKNTHPIALFIELGNINHQRDMQRLIVTENRQALAKWMAEACLADFKGR